MTDNLILTVKDVVDSTGELIVAFGNQNTILVYDDTKEAPSQGDTVRVDDQQRQAVELIQSGGSDTGNLVAVVKRVSPERVVVQTENNHLSVSNPDNIDLDIENIVEMCPISGKILRIIEDIDPLSFDTESENSDIKRYRKTPEYVFTRRVQRQAQYEPVKSSRCLGQLV